MLEIQQFWEQVFPMFTDYGFIYVFLDFLTIYVLIEAIITIPGLILIRSNNNLWKD